MLSRIRIITLFIALTLVQPFALTGCTTTADPTIEQSTVSIGEKPTTVRISSLKGPTSIGLAQMMPPSEEESDIDTYEFHITGGADEIVARLASGDTDIALLPANVAATVYAKTQAISVIDINTLGVLYVVSGDETIRSMEDLRSKKIYLSGRATTPDYVLSYLLREHGLSEGDVSIEYKSEPTEVVALLSADVNAIGILPEPYADAVGLKDPRLQIRIDLTEAWTNIQGTAGSQLVTGVTVVRNEFAENNPEALARFLNDHKRSVEFVNSNTGSAARIIADKGIIADLELAETIIPRCNIVCIAGDEMKAVLQGYLQVLFEADPSSVGGALPDSEFYRLS